jgi:hypothetical protein
MTNLAALEALILSADHTVAYPAMVELLRGLGAVGDDVALTKGIKAQLRASLTEIDPDQTMADEVAFPRVASHAAAALLATVSI